MGVTLAWPAVAVLGFVVLNCLVVALGTSATARYEFEHNGTRERQRTDARAHGSHPAGRRHPSTGATSTRSQAQAVDLAVRPSSAAATGEPAWWLVDDTAQVLAGPFTERIDADWAALADGLAAVAVHGIRSADGHVAPRPSPEERTFIAELGDQLDRLPRDWDDLLTETDPLTTLVVEVAAALLEAGLPLHEESQGGVCLMPELGSGGVVVSWRAHDRMSLHDLRGAAATDTVQQSMNVAMGDILWNLGFVVEPFGPTGTSLVTALR